MGALIFFIVVGTYAVFTIIKTDEYFRLKKEYEKLEILVTSEVSRQDELAKKEKDLKIKKDLISGLFLLPVFLIMVLAVIAMPVVFLWIGFFKLVEQTSSYNK